MRIRPLEVVNLVALAILCAVTLLLWRRLADPGEILLRYALMGAFMAIVVFLVQRLDRLPKALRIAADFYPAAFVPFVFESLGPLIPAARGAARDDLLIAADRAIFGADVTVWLERFVTPFWAAFFYVAYATYYFLPIVLGGALWKRDVEEARRFIFTLSVCFYVSYAGYFTIPAFGPRTAQAHLYTVPLESTAVARSISHTINELEHTKLDVFPSGHTMITVVVLIVAWRHARKVFWWLLPVAALLISSTVYCRYHYVVDLLAGIVLAFATVPIGERLYDSLVRWLRRTEDAGLRTEDSGSPLL